ncbi:MAG: transcription termination/antitermination factor NusG [Candidatus Glassbacteria bacterium RIFCSPLOWO2_12_FULL_58_11]|uniref:Transcription termination/antitermination protein NusG n=2 Tax=Candidatus Glassiibacteriota TaxID=1817805 RepID=A0A1F5Z2A7_9BACT|nr:MAG: transcription termination/antitermination factor NusG [Candidatus Glassbacteria bacterium GWA2_58_10]OGG06578.1 MAG: transcription termination/antitermination factor NusG [Candidatus Glassbacteria bacterium RIFCSPLOWO2_12_FULL_58_11]
MEDSKWYVLQVYSGHENKVKIRIEKLISDMQAMGSEPKITEVMVPVEEVTELRNGKKVKIEKKLYPGYVLIHMIADEETLHTLSNTQGIIKFAGGGVKPHPLREHEVNKIVRREERPVAGGATEEIPFKIGEFVEVIDGPFTEFNGRVEEIYPEKGKVKVVVSLFGRPTPLELDFLQLKKL